MKQRSCLFILLMILPGIIFFSCRQNKEIIPSADFAPYINAYTGGIISSKSPIRIELTQDLSKVVLNEEIESSLFRFSPDIKGKAYWTNSRTIEFVPEAGQLKGGELYNVEFDLGKIMEVGNDLKNFSFSFRVVGQNFAVHNLNYTVSSENPEMAAAKGEIRFSDKPDPDRVKEMFLISLEGDNSFSLNVEPTDDPSIYNFTIENIKRGKEDRNLTVKINGNPLNIATETEEKLIIPALSSFKFIEAKMINQPEEGVEVIFTDPVSKLQDLRGLVEIAEISDCVFQTEGNVIKIFFEKGNNKKITLNIDKGLQNYAGDPLAKSSSVSLNIESLNPKVEFLQSGTIMPNSQSLLLPFKTVNLWAVDVKVIRIFEKNVLMFLQTNNMSGSNELRRSGRLIYRTTIRLDEDPTNDLTQWNNFSVDLSKIINQEPGAIYSIEMSFKKDYSLYACGDSIVGKKQSEALSFVNAGGEISERDEEKWDQPYSYYYMENENMNWSEYNWQDRDDPCKPSYYMNTSNTHVTCNVFASNLGIIVKGNADKKLWVTVNNIPDTKPMSGVEIKAYNYQLQVIGSGKTNQDGFAVIETKGKPFVLMAENGTEKGYLRLVDGEEKSLSRFDVGGEFTEKGLKGYVFGERGVWRPGDTLFISFILEDKDKKIPNTHPVSFELYNPKGQFYTKQVSGQGVNGFYTFKVPTKPDDLTGVWNGYVKVGGATFHKSLRIETIKPNRLKINLDLPQKIKTGVGSMVPVKLSSHWLTGAKAGKLKANVEMTLSRVYTQFKGYEKYVFNNPAVQFQTQNTKIFDDRLDEEGNATINIKTPSATNAPGLLQATFVSRVFEPGGDVSTYVQSVPYSPFNSYVGLNTNMKGDDDYYYGNYFETDVDHTFDIVTLDPDGKPMDVADLDYRVYKVDWNWWWENRNSLDSYINNSSKTPIDSKTLNSRGGKVSVKFKVEYPEWGRYLVYVRNKESGHATGQVIYVDWPSWRGRSERENPEGLTMLTFSTDKKSYEVGEDMTIIIPAAAKGRALVAIENGSSVLQRSWVDVSDQGDTKYTIKITEEMTPNFYVHISLLQPHAQTVNDLPIRMYGVVPVSVTNRNSKLLPEISMPESLQPEKKFNVKVKEKSGKPMTYVVAIVDEGLLDLTAFKTPDPWSKFYAREALGIRTWDMYDEVIGAFTGKFSSLFSIGGDEQLKNSDQKANRFKPVVKFIGPFSLKKGETHTHELELPMYVGSVRTMVIAAEGGAYGNAEKTVPVKNPLMILSTLPRVMSTGEEILLPVNVFAMEDQVKEVTVSVETEGLSQLVSEKSQSLTFSKIGDQLAYFTLKAGAKTGVERVKVRASGNGQTASETIEIQVRNPNPPIITNESKLLGASQSVSFEYDLQNNLDENWVKLEVSRIPSIDMNRRFYYLMHYPHGCTEQLTSKAFPLLYIGDFKNMTEREEEAVKQRVRDAIRSLYTRQLSSGGFSYWPGEPYTYDWVSSYAGHFLCEARNRGYEVNQNVINNWINYQRRQAQNWSVETRAGSKRYYYYQYDLEQAYRLYTLALAGSPEIGAMNRMKEIKNLTLQAQWRLAATYALDGKSNVANELIFNLKNTVDHYSFSNSTYGSSQRDEAMILETLVLVGDLQKAFEQAKRVSKNLAAEDYFTTQTTAYSLLAMGKLVEKLDKGMIELAWSINGKEQPEIKTAKAVNQIDIPAAVSKGNLNIKNIGQGDLFLSFTTKLTPVIDTLPAVSNNIKLTVTYKDMAGKTIDVSKIPQGTDFIATISIANISGTDSYTDMALTHIIPSGWEIFNERMMTVSGGADNSSSYTYKDIRDDRVLTYFDLYRSQTKTFQVRLQAAYAGKYILPAIQCEAMYDTNVQGRTKSEKIEVIR